MRKFFRQITALLLVIALLSGCGLENKVNNDAVGTNTGNENPVETDGDSSMATGFRQIMNCHPCGRGYLPAAWAMRKTDGKK